MDSRRELHCKQASCYVNLWENEPVFTWFSTSANCCRVTDIFQALLNASYFSLCKLWSHLEWNLRLSSVVSLTDLTHNVSNQDRSRAPTPAQLEASKQSCCLKIQIFWSQACVLWLLTLVQCTNQNLNKRPIYHLRERAKHELCNRLFLDLVNTPVRIAV